MSAPKVQTIAAELRRSVESGEYRPGHQLPSARVLADRYGAARGTVSAAMTQLIREGLITSRPRAGWFVAEPVDVLEVPRAQLEETSGRARIIERVTVRAATPPDAERLRAKVGTPIFEIRRQALAADGTIKRQDSVLLTAADHELVYELPGEE